MKKREAGVSETDVANLTHAYDEFHGPSFQSFPNLFLFTSFWLLTRDFSERRIALSHDIFNEDTDENDEHWQWAKQCYHLLTKVVGRGVDDAQDVHDDLESFVQDCRAGYVRENSRLNPELPSAAPSVNIRTTLGPGP